MGLMVTLLGAGRRSLRRRGTPPNRTAFARRANRLHRRCNQQVTGRVVTRVPASHDARGF